MAKLISLAQPSITDREIASVLAALQSGWVSSAGPSIPEFEAAFARYIGTRYAVAVASGTVALHLALECLGVGSGDEVIVPDLTFVATANAVTYTGAAPVFADVEPRTFCIDPESVRRNLTHRTRAVIPVHLYGHPAELESLQRVVAPLGIPVIEDASQAHGALYRGRKAGSIGVEGIFSFYGNKILTTGEGGMLVTDREDLYQTARLLRGHAMTEDKTYWHTRIGFNYQMSNLQAALGLAQLARIEELLARRSQVLTWYRRLLEGVADLELNPAADYAQPVCWMVCLLLGAAHGARRNEIQKHLASSGVESRPFFHPLSSLPFYGGVSVAPRAREIAARGLLLPSSPCLTLEEVEHVTAALRAAL